MICSSRTTAQHATQDVPVGMRKCLPHMHGDRFPYDAMRSRWEVGSRFVPSCVFTVLIFCAYGQRRHLLVFVLPFRRRRRSRVLYCTIAFPLPHYSCLLSTCCQ